MAAWLTPCFPVCFALGSLATAQNAVAAIDAALSLPRTGTATYSPIWQHPTLAQWAIIADSVTQSASIMLALAHAGIVPPAAAAIDSTWQDMTLVWPTAQAVQAVGG